MINYGYIDSGYDERDFILDDYVAQQTRSMNLPSEYDFTKYLNIKCKDQGNKPYCVPYSIGLGMEIRKKLNGIEDFWIDVEDIFSQGGNEYGMMIRDALSYMRKTGYKSNNSDERYKITAYGKLQSYFAIKQSVYVNGPCVMGLPVRDDTREDFWNGGSVLGGHAISCVGWDEDGLILMNSWGGSFGYSGRCILPYDDVSKMLECWIIL